MADASPPRIRRHVKDLADAVDVLEQFEAAHDVRIAATTPSDGRVVTIVYASAPFGPMEPVTVGKRKVPRVYDIAREEPLVYLWRPNERPDVITIGARDVFNAWAFERGNIIEREMLQRAVRVLTDSRGAPKSLLAKELTRTAQPGTTPSLREEIEKHMAALLAADADAVLFDGAAPAGRDYAVKSLERAAAAVAASPENWHHDTCYMQSRLMGSYLAGGFPLEEEEVVKSLLAAGAGDRVVRAGIEAGKRSPAPWPPLGLRESPATT